MSRSADVSSPTLPQLSTPPRCILRLFNYFYYTFNSLFDKWWKLNPYNPWFPLSSDVSFLYSICFLIVLSKILLFVLSFFPGFLQQHNWKNHPIFLWLPATNSGPANFGPKTKIQLYLREIWARFSLWSKMVWAEGSKGRGAANLAEG